MTANQASIYLPFLRFDFNLPLVASSHILHPVVPITAMLPNTSCDLTRHFESERNDISIYNTLYGRAVDIVLSCLKRGQPEDNENLAKRQVADTKDYWQIALYYQFPDHLLNELMSCLVKNEDQFMAQLLIPINLCNLKQEDELHIYKDYRTDLQTHEEFTLELKR